MGEFVCRVADANGRVFSHVEAAGTLAEARQKLVDRGLYVYSVESRSGVLSGMRRQSGTPGRRHRLSHPQSTVQYADQSGIADFAGVGFARGSRFFAEIAAGHYADSRPRAGREVALRGGRGSGRFLEGIFDGDSGRREGGQPVGRAGLLHCVPEGEHRGTQEDFGDADVSGVVGGRVDGDRDVPGGRGDPEVCAAVSRLERGSAGADEGADRADGGLPIPVHIGSDWHRVTVAWRYTFGRGPKTAAWRSIG